jgi:hypothetical protein
MVEMGNYCKAYLVERFRAYPGWSPNLSQLEPDESGAARQELRDDDYLFLQENFTVTDGIFLNEHVVFNDVTDAWIEFCRSELAFEIPADLREDASPQDSAEPVTIDEPAGEAQVS